MNKDKNPLLELNEILGMIKGQRILLNSLVSEGIITPEIAEEYKLRLLFICPLIETHKLKNIDEISLEWNDDATGFRKD